MFCVWIQLLLDYFTLGHHYDLNWYKDEKLYLTPIKKIHHRVRLSIQCKLPDGNNEPATFFCNMQMKKPIGLVQKGWMQCYEEKTRDKKVIKP